MRKRPAGRRPTVHYFRRRDTRIRKPFFKKPTLVFAAKNLNKVLGLDPPIGIETHLVRSIYSEILSAFRLLEAGDLKRLKKTTLKVLKYSGIVPPEITFTDAFIAVMLKSARKTYKKLLEELVKAMTHLTPEAVDEKLKEHTDILLEVGALSITKKGTYYWTLDDTHRPE